MASAPQAIRDLFDLIKARIPEAVLSGIVGDVHHSFGYHLARNELPASDYSVELPLDRQGDAGSASALDVSLNPALMKTVTARLVAAAKARDPRLKALREFCGTLNGTQTYPWDLSTNSSEGVNSWDDSHLWHVHLSFYRAYANNAAVLAPIADVMAGIQEDDMTPAQAAQLAQAAASAKSAAAAVAAVQNTVKSLATLIERYSDLYVQFKQDPKEPAAIYLVSGGYLLWLTEEAFAARGKPTPFQAALTDRLYLMQIAPGTPDPRKGEK